MTNLQSETLPPIGDDYAIPAGCRDELLDDAGRPLPHARPLMAAVAVRIKPYGNGRQRVDESSVRLTPGIARA